jgi:hypothetical protein
LVNKGEKQYAVLKHSKNKESGKAVCRRDLKFKKLVHATKLTVPAWPLFNLMDTVEVANATATKFQLASGKHFRS